MPQPAEALPIGAIIARLPHQGAAPLSDNWMRFDTDRVQDQASPFDGQVLPAEVLSTLDRRIEWFIKIK